MAFFCLRAHRCVRNGAEDRCRLPGAGWTYFFGETGSKPMGLLPEILYFGFYVDDLDDEPEDDFDGDESLFVDLVLFESLEELVLSESFLAACL